jgi:peptidyl-prolyl cis-trans isomerase SurA
MSAIPKLILAIASAVAVLFSPQAAHAQKPTLVDRVVAIVNDDVITQVELEARVAQIRSQLRRQNTAAPPPGILERQVLDLLIDEQIQLQLARDRGIRITEAQLDRVVERFAADNGLDVEQLRARVAAEGMSFEAFRRQLRSEYLRARLREREVDSKIHVSEADVDAWLAAAQGGAQGAEAPVEYEVGQVLVPVAQDAPDDEVARQRDRARAIAERLRAGEDIERLAAEVSGSGAPGQPVSLGWRDASRQPTLFLDAIRNLEAGGVADPVRSPNGFHVLKLLGRRDAGGGSLASVPVVQTHVRHILVQPNELLPEAEAMRRLSDIRERVLAGTATFEDMARQYSSDGSAGRGGDIGWVYPGDTVPEFERAMNALAPGEISDIVRTPFGLHLVQVLARRNDQASPERLRQAARQAVRQERAREAYEIWVEQLRDSAYVVIREE